MKVLQARQNWGFEVAQFACIKIHINAMLSPQMRVKCIKIFKFVIIFALWTIYFVIRVASLVVCEKFCTRKML
jgi:hypothetical protein